MVKYFIYNKDKKSIRVKLLTNKERARSNIRKVYINYRNHAKKIENRKKAWNKT